MVLHLVSLFGAVICISLLGSTVVVQSGSNNSFFVEKFLEIKLGFDLDGFGRIELHPESCHVVVYPDQFPEFLQKCQK